jgi:peptide/nickel transport system ATP-binding protein
MAVVAYACDRIAVMYAGRIVEAGPAGQVLEQPLHPYTMGVTHAFPDMHGDIADLVPIDGAPPSLIDPPACCRFAARCPFALPVCHTEAPPLQARADDHLAACWRAGEAATLRRRAAEPTTWATA